MGDEAGADGARQFTRVVGWSFVGLTMGGYGAGCGLMWRVFITEK